MPASDHVPKPYAGPSREEILAMRRKYTNPAVFTLYGDPLRIMQSTVWESARDLQGGVGQCDFCLLMKATYSRLQETLLVH